jgi:hypothetical protein
MASQPSASRRSYWSPGWREVVFVLSATSIWCLLAEFYGLLSMRSFTGCISIPCLLLLVVAGAWDRVRGDGLLWTALWVGGIAGFFAAVAYDVFRLPFVFARPLGIDAFVPAMNMFKVFPRFGALILGQSLEQPAYSLAAQLTGWAYHFSNGVTFGCMYLAILGTTGRSRWFWGVLLAVGLEAAMLATPYTTYFGIPRTPVFVGVTLTAHLVFGVVLGETVRRLGLRRSMAGGSLPAAAAR